MLRSILELPNKPAVRFLPPLVSPQRLTFSRLGHLRRQLRAIESNRRGRYAQRRRLDDGTLFFLRRPSGLAISLFLCSSIAFSRSQCKLADTLLRRSRFETPYSQLSSATRHSPFLTSTRTNGTSPLQYTTSSVTWSSRASRSSGVSPLSRSRMKRWMICGRTLLLSAMCHRCVLFFRLRPYTLLSDLSVLHSDV
jgi:hypothetical protein